MIGAWTVRPRPGGQVSCPFRWDELETIEPAALTLVTVPGRVAEAGDPWSEMAESPQSLEPLLELHQRDMQAGLMDAPWPPVYPKMPKRAAAGRAEQSSKSLSVVQRGSNPRGFVALAWV